MLPAPAPARTLRSLGQQQLAPLFTIKPRHINAVAPMSQQPAPAPVPLSELSPPDRFAALYISSVEVVKRLGITRATLLQARRAGQMPGYIFVNDADSTIWERAAIEPYLAAWEQQRAAREHRAALTAPTRKPRK